MCYFCNENDHSIANCPVKNTVCSKCQQKGHLTQKCSLAEKLKSFERTKIDYSELYVEEETNIITDSTILQPPNVETNILEFLSKHGSNFVPSINDTSASQTKRNPKHDSKNLDLAPNDFADLLDPFDPVLTPQPQPNFQKAMNSKTLNTPIITRFQTKRHSESDSASDPKKIHNRGKNRR